MHNRIKTPPEIEAIRISGKMLAQVLTHLEQVVEAGQSTKDLADIAAKELKALGGKPAFLGYYGFPDVLCTSINDAVIHGIPRRDEVLQNGDIVGLDFGVNYNGMITDSALSCVVGQGASSSRLLLKKTEEALMAGINVVKDSVKIGDIAAAIEKVLKQAGFGIVREYVGHGVGHHVHEEPNIPNYGTAGTGGILKSGMTIAIEPMATLGDEQVYVTDDGWTVKTRDKSLAAHFEHTILVTDAGYEILTERNE